MLLVQVVIAGQHTDSLFLGTLRAVSIDVSHDVPMSQCESLIGDTAIVGCARALVIDRTAPFARVTRTVVCHPDLPSVD